MTPNDTPTICYGGEEYEFCASQLASYIGKVTGKTPHIESSKRLGTPETGSFVIGPPDDNPVTEEIDRSLRGAISSAIEPEQSFVIWPVTRKRRNHVVLAGADPVSTLYAVYTYLEDLCHVAFFEDGEYVPRSEKVPLKGHPIIHAPRFVDRKAPFKLGVGHWGIRKFYSRFWTLEEFKECVRWGAKRRLNLLVTGLTIESGTTFHLAREVCEELGYPIDAADEGMIDASGFPAGWSWPFDVRERNMIEGMAYARSLGFRFIYGFRLGDVPRQFKEKYPQFKYIGDKSERWNHAQLHPDDPLHDEFTSRYIRKVIEKYGTDHMYCGSPYCEMDPEGSDKTSFELKKNAALKWVNLLKRTDSSAIWVSDSWDYFWSPKTWTRPRLKQYLNALPDDRFYIYDTNADNRAVPLYREHSYFHGKKWAFGIMHSAATVDQIHGDYGLILGRTLEAATKPEARNCRGVTLVPEFSHYNPVFYDFLTRVAWDPRDIDLDSYFDDMVLRRYGKTSARKLRPAIGDIVEALFTRELNIPVYNLATLKWVWKNHAPWIQTHTIPRLHRGITRLLSERGNQSGNALYENDLVSFTKAYLAEVAAYHFHNAHSAYSSGDVEVFGTEATLCIDSVAWIARILSTRKDYTLADTIEHAMKVPGTNPETPRMILQGVINWDYCANDSYEQVANYDVPRLESYFAILGKKLEAGLPPIDMWQIVEKEVRPDHDDWVTGKRTLERTITFDGDCASAVTAAFQSCSANLPCQVLEGNPLKTGRVSGWRSSMGPKDWKTGKKGARIDGNTISSDPACGPMGSLMYKEWVDMPYWGTVITSPSSGISKVDLRKSPRLTIRYRVRSGVDYFHLWINWKGKTGTKYRTRIWRTFSLDHRWRTDTLDLLHALTCHGDSPRRIISLEFGTANPPHQLEIKSIEITG